SIAALGQALEIAPQHRAAGEGQVRARVACAALAVRLGDLAAAGAQLDRLPPDEPTARELRAKVADLVAQRAAERRRRRRALGAIAAGLVLAIVVAAFGFRDLKRARGVEAGSQRRRQAVARAEAATWRDPVE